MAGLGIPWYHYPTAILRAIWVFCSLFYSIIPHMIWVMLLRPLIWISPRRYWWIEGWLFNFLQTVVASWLTTCGHCGKFFPKILCKNGISLWLCPLDFLYIIYFSGFCVHSLYCCSWTTWWWHFSNLWQGDFGIGQPPVYGRYTRNDVYMSAQRQSG